MTEKRELLEKLEDAKLIDVVKNYRQYGYDEEVRSAAINILKERGITEDDLKMGGNFSNHTYDNAEDSYRSYCNNSKIAFALYITLLLFIVAIPVVNFTNGTLVGVLLILKIICTISYLAFITVSFINHSDFYKAINKKISSADIMIYYTVGMPFYIFMYFFYKSQMNEEMKMIQ